MFCLVCVAGCLGVLQSVVLNVRVLDELPLAGAELEGVVGILPRLGQHHFGVVDPGDGLQGRL